MAFMTEADSKPKLVYPEGMIQAVCVGVYDLGIQRTEYKGKTRENRACILMFEIDHENDGHRMLISKRYNSITLSNEVNYKSGLQKDLESWRGRAFSEEQIQEGVDLYELYGINCMLNIQKSNTGYYNIVSIVGKIKSLPNLDPHRPVSEPIPDWIVKIIDKQIVRGNPERGYADEPTRDTEFIDDIPF
jgi:hypothetical protein